MASERCRSIKAFCSRFRSSTCRTMFSKSNDDDDSVSVWGICKMMKDIHYFKINKLNEALNRQSIKAAFSQRKNLKFFKNTETQLGEIGYSIQFNSFDQRMHFYLLFEALYGGSDGCCCCCCCCCCGWLWCGWLRCGWLWGGWLRGGWLRGGWLRCGWLRRGWLRRGWLWCGRRRRRRFSNNRL